MADIKQIEELDNVLEAMKTLTDFSRKISEITSTANGNENAMNTKINDIMHKIELQELSDFEMLQMSYDIQFAKRERRRFKDYAYKLAPFQHLFGSKAVSDALTIIYKTIPSLDKRLNEKDERVYQMRDENGVIKREYLEYEPVVLEKPFTRQKGRKHFRRFGK